MRKEDHLQAIKRLRKQKEEEKRRVEKRIAEEKKRVERRKAEEKNERLADVTASLVGTLKECVWKSKGKLKAS